MKITNSIELFELLKKNKIGPFLAKGFRNDRTKGDYAENNKSQSITWIIIRAQNRNERLEFMTDFLDSKRIEYKITSWNQSSFPYLSIQPESKKEIRIVFKFLVGMDSKNYHWWNEALDNLFKTKQNLRKTPSDKNEIEVITTINQQIEKLGQNLPVKLKIQNKIFNDVVGFVGGSAGKKADFVIINKNGDDIGYISYKSGSSATQFQQYAGIQKSAKKDEDNSLFLSSDKEVIEFTTKAENLYRSDDNYFNKNSVYKIINDPTLKNKAVFGEEYGRKKSENNVDFFAQGIPKLIERNGIINLFFSKRLVHNGELSRLRGDYEPVLGIRKGETNRYLKTIKGVRGGIWTKKYMKTRRNSKNIKNTP
jgi:hypothetical protein